MSVPDLIQNGVNYGPLVECSLKGGIGPAFYVEDYRVEKLEGVTAIGPVTSPVYEHLTVLIALNTWLDIPVYVKTRKDAKLVAIMFSHKFKPSIQADSRILVSFEGGKQIGVARTLKDFYKSVSAEKMTQTKID